MLRLKNKKILVTGGNGFLGSWVVKELEKRGAQHIFAPHSKQCDLRTIAGCKKAVVGADIVVHIAARVGGIGLNKKYPGQLFYDNAVMGIHLMEEARQAGVSKMLIIGTACSYPKNSLVPFKEKHLWDGYPEEVTGMYGMAKKMLLVQAQAYRKEYGFNTIFLIPVNLYGPGDHIDPEYGHVLPSLIRKIVDAKKQHKKEVVVWGNGRATREFLYVQDAAKGIVDALIQYDGPEPVNLGTGAEISIKKLVMTLKKKLNYSGRIVWDTTKPNGQLRRSMDTRLAREYFGFTAPTSLDRGLEKTIEWFLKVT